MPVAPCPAPRRAAGLSLHPPAGLMPMLCSRDVVALGTGRDVMMVEGPLVGEAGVTLLGTPVSPSPILEDKSCSSPPGLALPWDAAAGCIPISPPKLSWGVTMGQGARGLPVPIPDLPRDPMPELESVRWSGEELLGPSGVGTLPHCP